MKIFGVLIFVATRSPNLDQVIKHPLKRSVLVHTTSRRGKAADAVAVIKLAQSMFCSGSAIIDPLEVVIAAALADREELIHADVSEDLVLSARGRVESFAHRRQELY